ncbi:MAG: hypothetical protein ABIL70_06925 [candidate division WOR-3 bacterium]
MLRSEFEEILITETPYYQKLRHDYRDVVGFKRHLEVLRRILPNAPFLNYFVQKEGKEFVFLGRKIFVLQTEFIQNYLEFLQDNSLTKWENFFERYSNSLFEVYKKFVAGNGNRIFIFEIVNRKLLRDILTKETAGKSTDEKAMAAERIGIVVNQLFNYIRNSLSRGLFYSDAIIVETYEKIPLLPRCTRGEMPKLLGKLLLKNGLPELLFSAILRRMLNYYFEKDVQQIIKEIDGLGYLINRQTITEILNSHFLFPDEKAFQQIMLFVQNKAKGMINALSVRINSLEKEMKDLEEKIVFTNKTLNEELMDITRNLCTEEALDTQLKKIKRNLQNFGYDLRRLKKEYQDKLKQKNELEGLIKMEPKKLSQFIIRDEWEPFLILLLGERREEVISGEELQSLLKECASELKNDREAMEVINELKIPGLFKERYNDKEVIKRFNEIIKGIIRPVLVSFLLEELIDYYPKITGTTEAENIRYVAEEALKGNVQLIEKDIKTIPKIEPVATLNIHRYKNLVSVLVYDIRGSTFMGTKLQDAMRESEIRNLFQETMLAVVEKYGGLPIKDTGDGGIVLFARNNYAIKKNETTALEPGSALDAVRCGLEMTREAMDFVQENINRYKDWFYEAEERKIDFEGATYATLPPSYQAIFQIGVGIASGEYPREIYLDKNAFGDIDLTGMLVREANFYAKIKAKEKSTVVCDDSTVYNLLLNVEKFSFLSDAGLRVDSLSLDVEQGLEYWINQRMTRRGFILDFYKILISKLGEEVIHPGNVRILLGVGDILIDETGEIKDGKGGRGKFIFEITQGT